MAERTADQTPTKPEKRRSRRFPVVVPVEVKWQELGGKIFKEAAQAAEVNGQGGLLDMKIYPWVGGNLELTNLLSGESTQARLVGTRHSQDGAFLGVAVTLVVPSESFWGVKFPTQENQHRSCQDRGGNRVRRRRPSHTERVPRGSGLRTQSRVGGSGVA